MTDSGYLAMKKFLRFFSLTTASQVCLVLNQLVLLPLQLRLWGSQITSQWLVVLAVANLATIADLGLRSAGHAQLSASVRTGDEAAKREFQQIWTLTRVLMFAISSALLVGRAAFGEAGRFSWDVAVTVSIAIDTLIIVRGIWLDTLGYFNRVEAVFLAMIASRLILTVVALLAFHAGPLTVGILMVASSVSGATTQAIVLSKPATLAYMAGDWRVLRWRCLAIVRYVVADPASNWMRLSLPVIVLASISGPRLVTTYVALRAVFGLARQVVTQLGRYASVQFARVQNESRSVAETMVVRFMLLSMFVGLAVSTIVVSDHGRIFQVWLHSSDVRQERVIALSFSVGALSSGYQIVAGAMTRSGKVVDVATRQYAYLLLSGGAAAIAWFSGSVNVYLVLLAIQEIVLAVLFVGALGTRIAGAFFVAFTVAACLVAALWISAETDLAGLFAHGATRAILATFVATGAVAGLGIPCLVAIDRLFARCSAESAGAE